MEGILKLRLFAVVFADCVSHEREMFACLTGCCSKNFGLLFTEQDVGFCWNFQGAVICTCSHEYQIFQKVVKLEYEFPDGFPVHAKDLVTKLLVM